MIVATRLALLACCVTLIPLLGGYSSATGAQDPQDGTAPFERKGKFVDDAATCADCHEDEAEAIGKGVHARVPGSKLLHACETCHGPGALHADENEAAQITMPARLPVAAQRRLCAQCHADQLAEHGGPLAELLTAGKRCTDCHKVHQARADIPGAGDRRVFRQRSQMRTNRDAPAKAGPPHAVGLTRCATCHADKSYSLRTGTHPELFVRKSLPNHKTWHASEACEACHGPGSAHVASNGLARLITRPDLAADGIATCRQCHPTVDPVRFHWTRGTAPLIGAPRGGALTCTTCHRVHEDGDPTLAETSLAAVASPHRRARPASRPAAARTASAVDRSLDGTVDASTCAQCHAPAYDVVHKSIHASLVAPGGQGCIACHAGGGKHAATGGAKALVVSMKHAEPSQQAQTCNTCHGNNRAVCGYSLGVHARARLGCLSCHSPATRRTARAVQRDAHRNCATCHAAVALSFRHANRHPVGEAEFSCASCHDPHRPIRPGPGARRKMSRRCVGCHKEYRGPFVFPHHADKGEGCLACHMPHGSPNRKLLDKRRVRDNCLSCHADLPPFHDQSTGSRFRNCLDCHTQIHGSNRHRFFFR